jgi:hypothetical protein
MRVVGQKTGIYSLDIKIKQPSHRIMAREQGRHRVFLACSTASGDLEGAKPLSPFSCAPWPG